MVSAAWRCAGFVLAVVNPEQEKTVNEYDAANRLLSKEVFAHKADANPVKRVSYQYNALNQYEGYRQSVEGSEPHSPVDGANGEQSVGECGSDPCFMTEHYQYNELNQLTQVTVDFGAFSKSYSYSYYPDGLKKTYTNPEGETCTYYYNKNNQFQAIIIPGHGQMSIDSFKWLAPQRK